MTKCSISPQAAYDNGLELLEQREAALALPKLEEALQGSLAHMESCRAGCEGPEEHQGAEGEKEEGSQGGLYEAIAGEGSDRVPWESTHTHPHRRRSHTAEGSFVLPSAGHWIRVLQCRQHCVADTATRPGRSFPVQDFIPSQLRRLHEAYIQGQLGKDGTWEGRFVSNAILSCISLFFPSDSALLASLMGTTTSGWCPLAPLCGPQEMGYWLLQPWLLLFSLSFSP